MTKDLIFIHDNKVVTDSLTVADVFSKNHDKVMRDIKKQLSKLNEAGEGEWGIANFGEAQYQHHQNKQYYNKYNMTEDAFAIIAMSYITPEAMKMKVKFIQEFKRMKEELEKKLKPQITYSYMIEDPIERAKRWIEEQQEKQLLEQTVKEQKPKVEVYNQIADASNSNSMKVIAKNVGVGIVKLYEFLRCTNIMFRQGKDNIPYQNYMNKDYFNVVARTNQDDKGNTYTNYTTYVYGKGELLIMNTINKYGGSKKINNMKKDDIAEYVAKVNEELKKPVVQ